MANYDKRNKANEGYRGQGDRREQDNRKGQRQNSHQPRREEQVTLTAPYQFAELNKDVYFPGWASQVSQDIPFSDGIDGVIEVTLKNVSPLFTRNGGAQDKKEVLSAHILENGQRRYLIPATTLKGMLRSTMEIMSFAKMQLFDDKYFAYRSFHKNDGDEDLYKKYHSAMGANPNADYDERKFGCGWLMMDDDDQLYITPCDGRFKRIHHNEIGRKLTKKTPFARNEEIEWYPLKQKDGNQYYIVCTGDINRKVKEYLFPTATLPTIKVDEKVAKKFMDVHDGPSPDFDKYLLRLKRGKKVAVFYAKDDKGAPKAIGLSRMLRYPFDNGVKDLVEKQQTDYKSECRDLCEIIWGYAESEKSLKGRIQVGHAFCKQLIDDGLLIDGSGILGQPKASFYPLYLKQSDATNKFKTYNSATGIAGRKLYKIHRGGTTTPLPQGNNNENATTRFKAIPSGNEFKFYIRVHNLRPIELGALLSALTLNETHGAFHNIGMAKAYGFGKIQIESVKLGKEFEKSAEEYMHDFEYEMTQWTLATCGREWAKTNSVNNLISILQEHSDEDVKSLQLNGGINGKTDEFRIAKRYVQQMPFRGIGIHSFYTQEDRNNISEKVERRRLDNLYCKAKKAVEEEQYEEAIRVYEDIKYQLTAKDVNAAQEDMLIKDVLEIIESKKKQEDVERKKREDEEKMKKITAGLAAVLEELYEYGENKGKPKVNAMAICIQKTDKWLKDAQRAELTEQECADFIATVRRLRKTPIKKEAKDWATFNKGKIWPYITKRIGEKAALELFNE